jgi:hypothetical protein
MDLVAVNFNSSIENSFNITLQVNSSVPEIVNIAPKPSLITFTGFELILFIIRFESISSIFHIFGKTKYHDFIQSIFELHFSIKISTLQLHNQHASLSSCFRTATKKLSIEFYSISLW